MTIERPLHIPLHWESASVEQLTEFVTSGSRGWAKYYADDGPLFLRVGNLNHDTIAIDLSDTAHVQPPDGAEGARTQVEVGDIFLSITAEVGMVGLAKNDLGEAYVNQHVALLRPRPSVWPAGLAYSFLDPQGLQALARKAQYGATKFGLSLTQVRGFQVGVPPLEEQHRIVEELDSYLSRIDESVALLERVQRNLKRYRASVLKAAVEGRLVPTEAELARAEKRDYEPASVLLERILVERRQRWKSEGRRGKYEEPEQPDAKGLPGPPRGWCWVSPGQLFGWSSGSFLPKKDQHGGEVPVYGGNGVGGFHDHANVQEPTLIVGRVGAHCGNIHITEGPAWITDNAIFAAYRPSAIHLRYWQFALSAHNLNAAAGGTGQPYVNQKHLNDLVVALPPLMEQERIAEEIERRLSLVEHASCITAANLSRCGRLRQSILKWAFEGKLVDQEPTDEPASALLKRIRDEHESNPSAASRRAGRPRSPNKETHP